MDINEVADELYGLEPADFVEIRTARAKEARATGDRALAGKIAGLRRPTTVAWMVNILAREDAEDVENLLELGEAMREAQRHLAGDDLRSLTTRRQQVVRALARKAGALAAEHGHQASETALREVGQSLHAALADPEIGELVRAGRLLSAVSYSGMGPAGLTLVGGSETKRASTRASTRASRKESFDDALASARADLAEAEEAERAAVSTARDARKDADRTEAAAGDASHRVAELREQLTQAEQELQFARRAEQVATDHAAVSDREAEQAREKAAKIRKKLDSLVADTR